MKAPVMFGSTPEETQGRPPTEPPAAPRRRAWLGGVAAINAVAAWGGALALIAGVMDFGEVNNARLPFDSVVLAGLALAMIVALPLTLLAWSAWTARPRVEELTAAVGLLLVGWILLQVAVLRAFSWFQPLYLALGACFVAASGRVRLNAAVRGTLAFALGAVAAAIGVGLLPHLVKDGVSAMALLSIALLFAAIAMLAAGARTTWRGRRRRAQVAGAVASVAVLAVVLSSVAPAVAATNVPSSHVTATPSTLGLDHQTVTLRTADGVELAAWYLHGANGAGVVVLHGAGSTRSAVLEQAAALVDAGYAVVLLDARGHGDSDGTAMDFGWYGDLDIAAATEFLASRPEIDPGRIGVVGFSMGGEQAIGAAATNPRIRAVVAEGATARQVADKAWLSGTYGWRGWLQEQLERIQCAVTDYLTEASPPVALRSAVGRAADTTFLLITAGKVADEGHAAAYIRSGGEERTTLWSVEGAEHTGGYGAHPEEWRQRVVTFLDENLS